MRTLINGVTAITLDEDNRILPHINIAHPPPAKHLPEWQRPCWPD